MKSAEAIKEMGKAILCLHIEVSENVAKNIQKKWNELMFSLMDKEKEIREDQREIDAKIARKWLNQTDPCDIETAILNAGKEGENNE